MLKLIPFVVALLLSVPPQAGPRPTGLPTAADYPAEDRALWAEVHREAASSLAARRLVEAPDSPETVRILATAKKLDDLLVVLRRIVDTQPGRIPDAFEAAVPALGEFRGDSSRVAEQKDVLRRIVADARPKLAELPREDAARAERVFIVVDSHVSSDRNSYRPALERFVEQYRGTEAALLTEVDVISNGAVSQQMLDALDAFVRAHPGTTAAAKALYQLGFQWHTINLLGRIEPRDADPTPRFFRVLDIVKDLESGRYRRSEWTEKAPSLIWQFFFPDKVKIAPDNLDRLLAAVEDFAATHFDLNTDSPGNSAVTYFLTSRLGELYERKGERTAGVDAAFSRLEKRVPDSASVRFVRATFYLQAPRTESSRERGVRLAKARRLLGAVSNEGRALVHRQALATLAAMDFTEGNYADARASFRRYSRAYPDSNWAWVASIRAGQCEEALGNAAAAAQMYLAAIPSDASVPMVRVLGHEYAARAFELAGDFPRALEEHEKALGAWSRDASPVYTTYWRRSPTVDPFLLPASAGGVARDALVLRIAQLQRLLSVPGGVRLERGRVLLASGRHDQALEELRGLIAEFPTSSASQEGRELAHRVRLERALKLAAADGPDTNEAAAIAELDALSGEPLDFPVLVARIARASLLARGKDPLTGESSLQQALEDWQGAQVIKPPVGGLALDVTEIRRVLFIPQGGGVYGTAWSAFRSPTVRPFMLVNSEVRVKLRDGSVTRVNATQTFTVPGAVLFFDTEQIAFLESIISTLGGTKRRQPNQIMEVPNQPVGDSMQILALWNRFFPSIPGHWGGWEIETYPVVTEIEFTNVERTKASARVTIGYEGGTVELEKEGSTWVAKRLTNRWIT